MKKFLARFLGRWRIVPRDPAMNWLIGADLVGFRFVSQDFRAVRCGSDVLFFAPDADSVKLLLRNQNEILRLSRAAQLFVFVGCISDVC